MEPNMATPIIFLDLDGPMIPWWNKRVEDPTGNAGRVVDGFPFLSRFHDDAIDNLRFITEATGAKIVTNSTHNGGFSGTRGFDHIYRVFKANGVDDLLLGTPDGSDWPIYISGFKNIALRDWKGRKDRALGIKAWFTRFGKSTTSVPFVAIDDSVEDFNINNSRSSVKIPYVMTATTANGLDIITDADALAAIKIIKSHPNYRGKI